MELKSREYYKDYSKKLKFNTRALIDGKFVESSSGKKFVTVNPATGEPITEITSCTREDVYTAEQAARKAFNDGRWARMSPAARKEILIRLGDLIDKHGEELAVMETIDSGKPIYDNTQGDIPDTAMTFRWHAEAIDKLEDTMTAGDGEHVSMIVREPLGVVGAILPWNFPIQMAAWKLAPILASGNSAIVKPAKLTSLTTLKLGELAMEAGIPDGVLNILPGSGSEIGNALGLHPELEALAFTGSTEVGKQLLECSGQSNAKRVLLEMGGKNPCVIMPDIKDLDHAAEEAVNAVFWNMGENCTSNSRLIVHESIKDAFLEKVIEKTRAWKTGDPLDPVNRLGALIEKSHMETILRYIETGKKKAARSFTAAAEYWKRPAATLLNPRYLTA